MIAVCITYSGLGLYPAFAPPLPGFPSLGPASGRAIETNQNLHHSGLMPADDRWPTDGLRFYSSPALARADLPAAERTAHQAERKQLHEEEYSETKHGGARGNQHTGGKAASGHGGQLPTPRYTADAAKKQGKSEWTLQREAARGTEIPDVAKLAGTSFDSPKELDALAKPSPEARGMPSRAAPKAVRGSAAIRGRIATSQPTLFGLLPAHGD